MLSVFTPRDLEQIRKRGSNAEDVERQFSYFAKGFPFARLERPATVGDGILRASRGEVAAAVSAPASGKVVKFVPASGAASRMFKPLFDMLEKNDGGASAREFLQEIEEYPFYRDLAEVLQDKGYSLEELIERGEYEVAIRHILFEEGLDYSRKPKALLKFFAYSEASRYAVEEHLLEAALYAKSPDGKCYLHFTVSPDHLSAFREVVERVRPQYEERFATRYEISYSLQDPATDTLAATAENLPFRDEQGVLLFRPGGHGALIGNLNALDADIIFVKNIDNITDEYHVDETVHYKKFLLSRLRAVRDEIFYHSRQLQQGGDPTAKEAAQKFVESLWGNILPAPCSPADLIRFLDRPLRICGMVLNEGEPGGGPFWVRDAGGRSSLQIVENSQIDLNDPLQKAIWENSTHFNPVDMVCSIKTWQGGKYDLQDFVDKESGFISEKSYHGNVLKAMELPGLWNGAMAGWATLFVEVPLATFHPVKRVQDLKAHHQNQGA